MDRDTIDDMDTIDMGLGVETAELLTRVEDALDADPEEQVPTAQMPVAGTIPWRASDPTIEPPRP